MEWNKNTPLFLPAELIHMYHKIPHAYVTDARHMLGLPQPDIPAHLQARAAVNVYHTEEGQTKGLETVEEGAAEGAERGGTGRGGQVVGDNEEPVEQ